MEYSTKTTKDISFLEKGYFKTISLVSDYGGLATTMLAGAMVGDGAQTISPETRDCAIPIGIGGLFGAPILSSGVLSGAEELDNYPSHTDTDTQPVNMYAQGQVLRNALAGVASGLAVQSINNPSLSNILPTLIFAGLATATHGFMRNSGKRRLENIIEEAKE